MKNNDLIERYIYAVTKHLEHSQREDVAKELQSIIDDMLEERCGEVVPEEKDIRIVLTELGTPSELAQKYMGDSKQCLIGQPVFGIYKFVMKIVCICEVFGVIVAALVSGVVDHASALQVAVNLISGIAGGLVTAFAVVTLIFAFIYQKGIRLDQKLQNLDNLPPVPKSSKKIPKSNAISGIVFSMIFVVAFIFCPQIFFVAFEETGHVAIPVFNVEYIKQTWYFILLFAILGIGRECVKLADGMYTNRLMIVTIFTDLCSGILTAVWFLNDSILNPKLIPALSAHFAEDGVVFTEAFGRINEFFTVVICFALLLDVLTTVIKTLKK